MTGDAPSAAQALTELVERRTAAQVRVDQLEAEQRASTEARETARAALVQAEREGVASPQRAKLEKALTDAEARAAERWPERIEGARAAVRDADQRVRRFATEHLGELIEGVQRDGQIAAEKVNACAEAFLRATEQRAETERNLISVVALTRQNDPRDFNRSRADEARAAVSTLLQQGGEVGPALRVELSANAAV